MEQVPRGIPSEGGSVQAVMWGKETVRCLRCVLSKALMAVLQQMRRVRRGEGPTQSRPRWKPQGRMTGTQGNARKRTKKSVG
jgi:hypothetical protein